MDALMLGWFEPVSLPKLGIERCYAKVDSGADVSTLHARDVVLVQGGNQSDAEIEFTPPLLRRQENHLEWPSGGVRRVRAPLVEQRIIKSSTGHEEARYVVRSVLVLGALTFDIDLTLTTRDGLRFPLLLGRAALAVPGQRILIDPARECLTDPACGSFVSG